MAKGTIGGTHLLMRQSCMLLVEERLMDGEIIIVSCNTPTTLGLAVVTPSNPL
jgi:hypothetical protein